MRASITIRAYNAASTIERALESARAQEFPRDEFEIIVVDDGSTDGTRTLVGARSDGPKMRVVHQKHRGAVAAANRGFVLSRGSYVTLLDADDELLPSFLHVTTARLEADPNIEFVYTDYYEEVEGVRRLVSVRDIFQTVAVGIVYRRASFNDIGFYRPDIFFAEYDVLLRTANLWQAAHIERPLFVYHRGTASLTANTRAVEEGKRQLRALHHGYDAEIARIRSYEIKEH